MRQRNLFFITLVSLAVIFTLAGCGGGGGSHTSTEETAIRTVFSAVDINAAAILGSNTILGSTSIGVKPLGVVGWTWDTYSVSDVSFSKVLAGVSVNGTTATATGTFTVSGNYTVGGLKTDGTTRWSSSGNFTLYGSGTIQFEKVADTWQISDIPGIILQSSATKSPVFGTTTRSVVPPATATPGIMYSVNTTVTSQNSGFRGYKFASRGFGDTTTMVYSGSNPILNWNANFTVDADATAGNKYGCLAVIELVAVDEPNYVYEMHFSSYITMIKVAIPLSM
jgi:hypothetical protein